MCIRTVSPVHDPSYFTQTFINNSITVAEEGNFVTCPFGVLFMLCTLLGSGGPRMNTSIQIGNAILGKDNYHHNNWKSLSSDAVQLYKSTLESLSGEMTSIDDQMTQVITLANGIYASDELKINEEFEHLLSKHFSEVIHRVNFADQLTVMKLINKWIADKTNNLIPQFFNHPQDIPPNALLSLFSVFYFKDVWEVPFIEMFTENSTFSVSSDRQIYVPIMSSEEELDYADFNSEGFEMISKSFKNTRFTFIVILPKDKWNANYTSLFLIQNNLLENYIQKLKNEQVSLKLPKFKLETLVDLEKTLKQLGIHDIFNPLKADFSGITNQWRMHVTSFQQKNVIRVDETGIEAGSVANAMFIPLHSYKNPIEFHVLHPFICFIYDKTLKLPLFAARVTEPLQ
ncbi:unnamed protein product [Schistosoma turkestanicum]|nr:unnamed protein product [Schistosoma turkestanicum]